MRTRLWQWLTFPQISDPELNRRATLLNILIPLSIVVFVLVYIFIAVFPVTDQAIPIIVVMLLSLVVEYLLLRAGYVRLVSNLYLTAGWLAATAAVITYGSFTQGSIFNYIAVVLIAGVLGDLPAALVIGMLSLAAGVVFGLLELNGQVLVNAGAYTLEETIFAQLSVLVANLGFAIFAVWISNRALRETLDRARHNERSMAEINRVLQQSRSELETQARALERRTRQLQLAAEIGRLSAMVTEADVLISRLAAFLGEQLNLYHAGIFIVDSLREYLVLEGASSDDGKRMINASYRLLTADSNPISTAWRSDTPITARAGTPSGIYLADPVLRDALSMVALPLRAGAEVLGVLDLRSTLVDGLSEDDLPGLQVIADQIAAAISAVQRLESAQQRLAAERRAAAAISREGWRTLLSTQREAGFRYTRNTLLPVTGDWHSEMVDAIKTGKQVAADGYDTPTLAVPLRVRGQVVGALRLRKSNPDHQWSPEEMTMLDQLADQLGVALDSARLYETTERRASRERLTAEVTARMRESLDMDVVLRTAVEEFQRMLNLEEVEVRMGLEANPNEEHPA